MARLRKFVCYRHLKRPYTRKSKYAKKAFVKVVPASKISRHEVGDPNAQFQYSVIIKPKIDLQIRHNALEAARQTANKVLETELGKNGFYLKLRVYPHHVIRENPLASGAGADRMSTGMAHSYGKSISTAAQIKRTQPIFEIKVDKNGLVHAKKAMKRIQHKLPTTCYTEIYEIKTNKQVFV